MPDWTKKFKTQYDDAKTVLASTDKFERDWRPLVRQLQKLVGDEGFDAGSEVALGELRSRIVKGPSQTATSEDKGLMTAADCWTDADTGTVDVEGRKRAAALKFLRHVYLLNKAGDRKVWIHSLPIDFTDWAHATLKDNASTTAKVKQLMRTGNEQFSEQQKRYLANSTQQALAWCQKTLIVLGNAATAGATGDSARELVSRWFAEPGLSDTTLANYVAALSAGFKKIVALLNKGHFVLTDWVPLRGATEASELSFLNSEAFTFRNGSEGLDVVYIERSFFVDSAGNVLPGQANWTRIVVHELTHLAVGTIDVNNGNARYAWYGIGPHAGYPGSDCIRNADNWAFFAADCAGVLTDAQRAQALTIK